MCVLCVHSSTHSFTLWDKWEVRGHKDFRLQDFFKAVKVCVCVCVCEQPELHFLVYRVPTDLIWSGASHDSARSEDDIHPNIPRTQEETETKVCVLVFVLFASLSHSHSMISLLKPPAGQLYVDLTVSFTSEEENEEDVPGPPIRYYF